MEGFRMIAKNCKAEELEKALEIINKKYEGNIKFNELIPGKPSKNQIQFTLRCISSKGPGHGIGNEYPWRDKKAPRLVSCCWHVHGDYFDALLSINQEAVIVARGKKIIHGYAVTKQGKLLRKWYANNRSKNMSVVDEAVKYIVE
jgi:hypothetical protein